MPLYTFNCPTHGLFELLLPLSESERKRAKCPDCSRFGSRAAELTTMRPDKFWSGQQTQYGYVTSQSQLKAEMKRRNHVTIGDRTDREGMDKIAERAAAAKEEATKKRIRQWSEKAFGPSGLGLGGADGAKMIKESADAKG